MLKEQNRALHVMQNVVGDRAEQHVTYLSATFMATDNQQLKFLCICHMADDIFGFPEFKHKFIGKTRLL